LSETPVRFFRPSSLPGGFEHDESADVVTSANLEETKRFEALAKLDAKSLKFASLETDRIAVLGTDICSAFGPPGFETGGPLF
jgi:hypothetical protein